MLYVVQCGFADPEQEDAWNDWYSGQKLDELLGMPGFVAAQRFRATTPCPEPYLAVYSIVSLAVFGHPAYLTGGGGTLGDWDPALVVNWSRRLFDGIDESPAVGDGQSLVILDAEPGDSGRLGLTWLEGIDWDEVGSYGGALGLDASIPHRGIAAVDTSEVADLESDSRLTVFAPLTEKRAGAFKK